ncbi:MAG: hypothetical protein ACE5H9_12415 [Anaerolineae bacterium]
MSSIRPSLLTADFFTADYRLSASVNVANRRLADILSDRISDFLEVRNVYVSRINSPGQIIGTYPQGALIKSHINFVVLPTEADGLSKDHTYPAFNRQANPAFMTLPSFEIRGKLQVTGKLNLRALLAIGTKKFMPLLQATATAALHPDISFSGPVILVNKVAIEVFCLDQS